MQHTLIHSRPPTKTPSISQIIQELLQLSPGLKGGGKRTPDAVPDLYPVYLALVDKLSNEESKGDTPYVRLSPTGRQLGEFRKLGLEAATDNALLDILLQRDHQPEQDSN